MKKTTYDFDTLLAKLRKFYETGAPVPPRCSKAKTDQIVFQHNVKKLSDDDLFLLAYVEEVDGNISRFYQFGEEIKSRGFTYGQYTEFLKSKGIPAIDDVIAEERAA